LRTHSGPASGHFDAPAELYGCGKKRTVGQNRRAHQPVPSWVPVMLET
jgi:hypothetical protein